ncbi:MAG: GntR family transcriptional regulator [Lachnospiraceae bacterium]|nr:GntR family transcriptional regulator [Lachnospiraceae bacterium]
MQSVELMPARVQITSILRKAILSGEYQGGQELSLVDVSEKLGISRTPVREAFQTLASEGLIELRMNKGAIVRVIDEKFVLDHFEVRILLEGEAAAKAAQNGMDVKTLLNRSRFMKEYLDDTDKEEYIELNQQIHMAIWTAAGNERLTNILQSLWNGPSIGKKNSEKEHFQKSIDEHIELLETIAKGNAEQARSVMAGHITRSRDNILAGIRDKL